MVDENTEDDKKDIEQIILLYEVTVSDIAFFKTQQLTVANYVVLIHAALLTIAYQFLKDILIWHKILLIGTAWIVLSAGIIFIMLLEYSIDGRRDRLERCRGYFGKKFNYAWKIFKLKDNIFLFFCLTIILSACITTLLILDKLC